MSSFLSVFQLDPFDFSYDIHSVFGSEILTAVGMKIQFLWGIAPGWLLSTLQQGDTQEGAVSLQFLKSKIKKHRFCRYDDIKSL